MYYILKKVMTLIKYYKYDGEDILKETNYTYTVNNIFFHFNIISCVSLLRFPLFNISLTANVASIWHGILNSYS